MSCVYIILASEGSFPSMRPSCWDGDKDSSCNHFVFGAVPLCFHQYCLSINPTRFLKLYLLLESFCQSERWPALSSYLLSLLLSHLDLLFLFFIFLFQYTATAELTVCYVFKSVGICILSALACVNFVQALMLCNTRKH